MRNETETRYAYKHDGAGRVTEKVTFSRGNAYVEKTEYDGGGNVTRRASYSESEIEYLRKKHGWREAPGLLESLDTRPYLSDDKWQKIQDDFAVEARQLRQELENGKIDFKKYNARRNGLLAGCESVISSHKVYFPSSYLSYLDPTDILPGISPLGGGFNNSNLTFAGGIVGGLSSLVYIGLTKAMGTYDEWGVFQPQRELLPVIAPIAMGLIGGMALGSAINHYYMKRKVEKIDKMFKEGKIKSLDEIK